MGSNCLCTRAVGVKWLGAVSWKCSFHKVENELSNPPLSTECIIIIFWKKSHQVGCTKQGRRQGKAKEIGFFKLTTHSVKDGGDSSKLLEPAALCEPAEKESLSDRSLCNKTSPRGTCMARAGIIRTSKYPGLWQFLGGFLDTCILEVL